MNRAADSFVEDSVVSDKPFFLAARLGHKVSWGTPRGRHSDTGDPLAVYQVIDDLVGHVSGVEGHLASVVSRDSGTGTERIETDTRRGLKIN